jgi:hypothetical protein
LSEKICLAPIAKTTLSQGRFLIVFLSSNEGQKSHETGVFDGQSELALVFRAGSGFLS